tara:strand:- start:167 stop:571 length:405 start_codon:yes stop_codon:yes gene_type:complete
MGLSRINSQSITDGSIATTDLADSAVTSAKIGVDVIAAEDLANNSITTAEISDGAVTQAKLDSSVSLGAGYYIANDGSVNGNANGRTNLFRVNTNATTGNVTIAANNNASVTGPLTIGNGFTLTITSTGRLAII